jgi:hypothetical protein
MSDPRMYVADELMEYWPFLPRREQRAKIACASRESKDSFLFNWDAKAQSRPVLAWKGSGGQIYGCWGATTAGRS